jgi:hypothetical protein
MNLAEYAGHRKARGLRGGSHVAVLKAIQSGRLTSPAVIRNGRNWIIDPSLADAQWADNTDQGNVGERSRPQAETQPPAITDVLKQRVPGQAQASAIRTMYQARLLELELKQKQGQLVPKADVDRVWFEEVRRASDGFRRLPLQMIGDVAQAVGGITQKQRADVLLVIERHIVEVLEVLSRDVG